MKFVIIFFYLLFVWLTHFSGNMPRCKLVKTFFYERNKPNQIKHWNLLKEIQEISSNVQIKEVR